MPSTAATEDVLCHQHHALCPFPFAIFETVFLFCFILQLYQDWPGAAGAGGEMPLGRHAGAKGASLVPKHWLERTLLTLAETVAFR